MEQKDLETLTAAGLLKEATRTDNISEYELTWEGKVYLRFATPPPVPKVGEYTLTHAHQRPATPDEVHAWAGCYADTYSCRPEDDANIYWYIEALGANEHTRKYWAARKANELMVLPARERPMKGARFVVTPNPRVGGWLQLAHAIEGEASGEQADALPPITAAEAIDAIWDVLNPDEPSAATHESIQLARIAALVARVRAGLE